MSNIVAVGDKIIVKRLEEPDSLVVIPDSEKEAPIEGIVVSRGEDVNVVNPGDHIMFDPRGSVTLTVQDQEYIAVYYKGVYAIIKDE